MEITNAEFVISNTDVKNVLQAPFPNTPLSADPMWANPASSIC